jgi:hypothetical protein
VKVSLSKLKVVKKNESTPDEPYVWVVFMKIDGSTVKLEHLAGAKAAFKASTSGHGNLGSASDDMDQGDSVSIPEAVGTWNTQLSLIDGLPDDLAKDASMIAAAVVVLEEDASSDARVAEARKRFVSGVKSKVAEILKKHSDGSLEAIIGAQEAAADTLFDRFFTNFSFSTFLQNIFRADVLGFLTISEVADPDDFVGLGVVGPFTYAQIRQAGSDGISIKLDVGGGGDGLYRIEGRLKGAKFPFAFAIEAPAALGYSTRSGSELRLFARGKDRQIYQSVKQGAGWTGWGLDAGTGNLASGPAVASCAASRVDLFGLGGDRRIWHSQRNGTVWSGWLSDLPLGHFSSGPAAVAPFAGRVDVFARGMDRRFYHSIGTSPGWSNWGPVGSGTFLYGPAAAARGRGELHVVGIGMDRHMYHSVCRNGAWAAWSPMGAGTFNSTPAITASGARMDAFARGMDDRFYQSVWLGSGWSGWGEVDDGRFKSGPAAISASAGRVQLFGIGGDDNVWMNSLGSGGWAGWSPHPGSGRFR